MSKASNYIKLIFESYSTWDYTWFRNVFCNLLTQLHEESEKENLPFNKLHDNILKSINNKLVDLYYTNKELKIINLLLTNRINLLNSRDLQEFSENQLKSDIKTILTNMNYYCDSSD